MEDYPHNWVEFDERFASEEACIAYLISLRWTKGFACPKVSNIKRSSGRPHELMPRVHRVSSLMKRWLLGTHQGSVSPKRLDYYLDEFTFRFNRRTSTHRGKLFFRLMEQAATSGPTTYGDVIGRPDPT